MANLMSQRAYSRHRGCALRAVQKAIEAGRITLVTGPDGKQYVDQVQADRDWDRNTDQAKQTLMHASTGATPAPPSASAPPRVAASDGGPDDDDAPEPEGQSDAYRKARAQREEIRRDRELLELEKLRGNLIALDEVRALAFTAFRTLRDSLLNVPARIKDEAAAQMDPLLVEQLIEREITAVLSSFDLAKVTSDQDEDDDEDEA